MRRIFSLILVWFLAFFAYADQREGWNLYLSYHDALSSQPVGEDIYANFGGNLLMYHPADGEIRTFSKLDGLNGREIISMEYSAEGKCLLLVYSDLGVDLFSLENGQVMSLPQIKNSGIDGLKLNRVFVQGENVLLALNYGLAHLNLKRQEMVGFYTFEEEIKAAAYHKGILYAAMADQLLACSAQGNPLDKNEWKSIQKAAFTHFVSCGNELYGVARKNIPGGLTTGLWLQKADGISFERITDAVFPLLFARKDKMVVADGSQLLFFDMKNPTQIEKKILFKNTWKGLSWAADGTLWASDSYNGLQAYQIVGDSLRAEGAPVGHYGPQRDLCYFMKYFGHRLLIAGGRLDPYDQVHCKGTLMEFTDGKWTNFQEEGISAETGVPYWDITSVAIDPKNENHVVVSAGGTGLYEFDKYKFTKHVDNINSPLESAAGTHRRYVRMDGLIYDADGNLWMANNSQKDTILRVRRPDGTWKGIFVEGLRYAPTCEKTLFDQKGRLWVSSRRTVNNHDGGLLCLDYNGTLNNTSDDVDTYRSSFVNQDGKSYKVGGVLSMAEDKDGAIWVGTRVGLFVISNPDAWPSSDFNVIQVKVPRNDGTNLADYLLADMPIMAIAVDGANRKWIGAEGSGLYLVSPDGTQILQHFDESNSPLLSNNIYSLAPNLVTGEIMIGTDKGICSYQSSATMPETSLDKHSIKVYPNPVRPEFKGNVRVTGLTENADVKVMTASGEVVAAGTSTGGTFVWNVRGGDGARVAAGIYYFMIATSDGNKGIAAKIVVI